MPRKRSIKIKPEFFTSLTVASLPLEARLTFIGLWTHVDETGVCLDNSRLIKAAVWPLDDERTAEDVEGDLNLLVGADLLTAFTRDGKRFLAVTNWDEHQRPRSREHTANVREHIPATDPNGPLGDAR